MVERTDALPPWQLVRSLGKVWCALLCVRVYVCVCGKGKGGYLNLYDFYLFACLNPWRIKV